MPYTKHGKPDRRYRQSAARKIQAAFRRRMKRKQQSRVSRQTVTRALIAKEPVQYSIFGKDSTNISQTPVIFANISNMNFDRDNANPTFYRSSSKVKPLNLNMKFRIDAQDAPYNQVTVCMVRHKRSTEIVNADIQGGLGGALTDAYDKPFLPSTLAPNSSAANMTGTSATARPELLTGLMNPKVVDLIWSKSFFVQPQWKATGGGPTATSYVAGNTYPMVKEFEVNHKFTNDTWKYQHQAAGGTVASFPYNNKCYHILAWSDSVIGTSHPTLSGNFRLSFKDLD